MLTRIAREPLVHFAILGALLFAFAGRSGTERDRERRIVVTRGQIEQLATTFTRTWQRPPTRAELDGLIDDWVRTEVAYRQALALGIDEGDTVVRRRLRQKLEFLTEDATAAEPTDAQLAAYLEAHADEFRSPDRYSLTQVYLSPERRADAARDAANVAKRLDDDPSLDPATLGDPLLVPRTLEDAPGPEIASVFGKQFAESLAALPIGHWSGPVTSGYGEHAVRIERRTPGRVPPLEAIRETVLREWQNAERTRLLEEAYRRMRAQYEVVVEPIDDDSSGTSATP